jgi:hypothetical protein
MTYLNELLTGYHKGLAGDPAKPIQALRTALSETDDPWQRGVLLGLLATALTARAGNRSSNAGNRSSNIETASTP